MKYCEAGRLVLNMKTSEMFHSAIAFQLFVKLTNKLKTNIASRSDSVMGYSKSIIESRLLQEFSALEMANFKSCAAKHYKNSKNKDNLNIGRIKSSCFIYSTITGELSITNSYLVKKIIRFIIHWHSIIFIYVRAIFTGSKLDKVFTLVYGIRVEDGLYLEFDDFCKYGSVSPLRESEHLIVESFTKKNFNYGDNTDYCNNPLHALISKNKPSFSDFVSFLLLHLKCAILYFKSVANYPLMVILEEDFSYQAIAISLNKEHLIKDIVITNSNMSRQLLWMSNLPNKTHTLHMAWYSQNAPFAFTFKADNIVIDEIGYRNIRVDETWVWTKYFANHLKNLGIPGIFHDIGPILWYLPPKNTPIKNKNCINIMVFDVVPKKRETLDLLGRSDFYVYNSFEIISKFILDIIRVSNTLEKAIGVEFKVMLKNKRGWGEHDDLRYVDFIDNLVNKGELILLEHTENVYSIISQSDIVVGSPYTSPIYVADHLGTPSVFYDPTEKLLPVYEESKGIEFISGKEELESGLGRLLHEKVQQNSRKV